MSEQLYQIDLGYACFGIVLNEKGSIIYTAPIFMWVKGKNIFEIKEWLLKKNAKIVKII